MYGPSVLVMQHTELTGQKKGLIALLEEVPGYDLMSLPKYALVRIKVVCLLI